MTGGGKHEEECGNMGTLCGRAMQIFGNPITQAVTLQRVRLTDRLPRRSIY